MGLDMFAWSVRADLVGDNVVDIRVTSDDDGYDDDDKRNIGIWRKFNHLHGWMERLYRSKGGTREDFNCTTVLLTEEDLAALEVALSNPAVSLPHTPGFFFGGDEIYPEDISGTRHFIAKAREEIKNGRKVLYDSWW